MKPAFAIKCGWNNLKDSIRCISFRQSCHILDSKLNKKKLNQNATRLTVDEELKYTYNELAREFKSRAHLT